MPMYNLIEYCNNYLKTPESLWKYYRDEPALNNDGAIITFDENNDNEFKEKITVKTGADGIKHIQIAVPLKHLSNFWRTL